MSDGAAAGAGPPRRVEPLRLPGFRGLWLSTSVGQVGAAVSVLAVDVLVIDVLHASETQVGIVRAAQFLPYLLIGLVAGAYVDRWRRRPTLVGANLAQAVLLLVIPALHLAGALTVPATALTLFGVAACGVIVAAAEQSYLPDLVPRGALVAANARIGQAATVAQTSGPAFGGLVVALLTAPFALALTALARLGSALLVAGIREVEPPPAPERPRLWRGIGEGLRLVYRHRTLGPLAISTHVWFLANSAVTTVLGLFVLRDLDLSVAAYGLVLTAAGVGALAGTLVSTRVAARLGDGRTVVLGRALMVPAWVAGALTPADAATWVPVLWLVAVQLVHGFGMGVEDAPEMGWWQLRTPRAMLGRVNASRRSANRTVAVVGALLGGVLAGAVGYRWTFVTVAAVFAVAASVVALSPMRDARIGAED
ncbi:MFS transporter [Georgenia sp. Z1491]|uniref:MFS transporter n=1 Tax=Georgenia sp. Z1491 TaxID=3416707 RepID=UPI003CED5209